MRNAALLLVVAVVVAACSSSGARSSADEDSYDVDTGPCSCRQGQDEGSMCCRSGMSMTCHCDGNFCHESPTGRRCRSSQGN